MKIENLLHERCFSNVLALCYVFKMLGILVCLHSEKKTCTFVACQNDFKVQLFGCSTHTAQCTLLTDNNLSNTRER